MLITFKPPLPCAHPQDGDPICAQPTTTGVLVQTEPPRWKLVPLCTLPAHTADVYSTPEEPELTLNLRYN